MNIVLTGYRGTGKSAVARLLAEKLGRQQVSLDEEIAGREGIALEQAELFDLLAGRFVHPVEGVVGVALLVPLTWHFAVVEGVDHQGRSEGHPGHRSDRPAYGEYYKWKLFPWP